MSWQREVLPVLVSIAIIILIAVLKNISSAFAAITATMPVNIPLALWILYAAERGQREAVVRFSDSMLIGLIGTLVFMVVIWMTARAGWKLLPMIAAAYAAWAACVGLTFGTRRLLGL